MISKEFASGYIHQIKQAADTIDVEKVQLVGLLIRQASRVFLCGNGGSASLADHIATDLQLAGVQALALTNIAALTTYANDYDYTQALRRQFMAMHPTPEDLLIAISTSGNSANVIQCASFAAALQVPVVAMTGGDGGQLGSREYVTCHLHVPSAHTGIVQDCHQTILHIIAYGLMKSGK